MIYEYIIHLYDRIEAKIEIDTDTLKIEAITLLSSPLDAPHTALPLPKTLSISRNGTEVAQFEISKNDIGNFPLNISRDIVSILRKLALDDSCTTLRIDHGNTIIKTTSGVHPDFEETIHQLHQLRQEAMLAAPAQHDDDMQMDEDAVNDHPVERLGEN